jgi:myo-inositol catabolism protein IolS
MQHATHSLVTIGPVAKAHSRLGLGCWSFGPQQWTGKEDKNLLEAMSAAVDSEITHFDTASGYGDGYSESLIGRFLAEDEERRARLFIASKSNLDELTAQSMLEAIRTSRSRLQTDSIDLYYIHWPRTGQDMRPVMEGLETARQQGLIGAIGVSNFSVEQMAQISEAGHIDAHQLNYNLFWRYREKDIIPYCVEHDIAVVTYSSAAHGILGGKFARELDLPDGDQRRGILLFREDVWPHIYTATEELKTLAAETGRPLIHLGIRWVLHQPAVTSVLVGARNARQVKQNAAALEGDIPAWAYERMTAISDQTLKHIPDVGNVFGHYP